MPTVKISLQQMLDARERRKQRQDELLSRFSLPLVCFTMNIAGDEKNNSRIRVAFNYGVEQLLKSNPIYHVLFDEATGMEGYFVFDMDGKRVKSLTTGIEEQQPIGRLFDMDVLSADGTKLEREQQRSCLVCGGQAAACARNREHGLEVVKGCTDALIDEFICSYLSQLAVDALKEEVALTPKAGLVDGNNNGSHTDMDLALFNLSADTLQPHFYQAVKLGLSGELSFDKLHRIGIAAETDMLCATNGVNTHKGANYSFLLLLSAIADSLKSGNNPFETASQLAKQHFAPKSTHGAMVRQKYGDSGVVKEAVDGFVHARQATRWLSNEDASSVLLRIMSTLVDTNVLYRGGEETLLWLQDRSKEILAFPQERRMDAVVELDKQCIEKNISPGGCADILALALFLSKLCILETFI